MSKYTLELRAIEETNKVFDFDYKFYVDSDEIKKEFEQKFIDEYYFNEIGFETIGRFKHRLRTKLNKIMPYYVQLYKTELEAQDINFLLNKDLIETYERTIQGNNTSTADIKVVDNGLSDTLESNIDNGNASIDLKSGYLTNVSKNSLSNNSSSNNKMLDNTNQTEKTSLRSQGNIGITSSAELLEKYRNTLLNIQELIINECYDLFMLVY